MDVLNGLADGIAETAEATRRAKELLEGPVQYQGAVQMNLRSGYFGHGWVVPRSDGVKARCGGPGLCRTCSQEQQALNKQQVVAPEIRELLQQADVALEKSRGLLKRSREALSTHPATARVSVLLAEITDLLGD